MSDKEKEKKRFIRCQLRDPQSSEVLKLNRIFSYNDEKTVTATKMAITPTENGICLDKWGFYYTFCLVVLYHSNIFTVILRYFCRYIRYPPRKSEKKCWVMKGHPVKTRRGDVLTSTDEYEDASGGPVGCGEGLVSVSFTIGGMQRYTCSVDIALKKVCRTGIFSSYHPWENPETSISLKKKSTRQQRHQWPLIRQNFFEVMPFWPIQFSMFVASLKVGLPCKEEWRLARCPGHPEGSFGFENSCKQWWRANENWESTRNCLGFKHQPAKQRHILLQDVHRTSCTKIKAAGLFFGDYYSR